MICELCKTDLTAFDIRMQDLLQGICLNCGKVSDWQHMTPEESRRCLELHAWANMTPDQRTAYDRNRGN
jgi:endogenous inhibitor of DNA gyrase (YacG/DUF329 family)